MQKRGVWAVRFLLTALAVSFGTATILALYESTKRGGYKRGVERSIIVFSIITGIVIAMALAGLMVPRIGGPFTTP